MTKLPKCYLLPIPLFLLHPLTMWLQHRQARDFFLGLSSQFWAGVTIGISIVLAALFLACMVLHLCSARALPPGDAQ